jgi:hypothetical protein
MQMLVAHEKGGIPVVSAEFSKPAIADPLAPVFMIASLAVELDDLPVDD